MISEEDNCAIVSEITEEDMNNAIRSIASLYVVIKAVSKFKRHSRTLSQQQNELQEKLENLQV